MPASKMWHKILLPQSHVNYTLLFIELLTCCRANVVLKLYRRLFRASVFVGVVLTLDAYTG